MAEKSQENDEYEFADLDVVNPEYTSEEETGSSSAPSYNVPREGGGKRDIRRNALIVVVIVILAMLIYKFTGSFISKKEKPAEMVPTTTTAFTPPVQPKIETKPVEVTPVEVPVVTQTPTTPPVEDVQLKQKLSALEQNQQNLRSDINNVSAQLQGLHDDLKGLHTQIDSLGQMVTTLSGTVQQQSAQIAMLSAKEQKKPIHRQAIHRPSTPLPEFYLQAVIPGRAWLIAKNGATITIREGTRVKGYGFIKLIDPVQGRVLTSSGRVIRFSQQDS